MSRATVKPKVRCAIYCRKSSEEGLEQSFNSLDAQREVLKRLGDPGYQPPAHEHVVWADPVRG